MRLCPITYKEIKDGNYSTEGLRAINKSLKSLFAFPFTQKEQQIESIKSSSRFSLPGNSLKLLANINPKTNSFFLEFLNGKFIIKPQSITRAAIPENEGLTMRLALESGIDVPACGLLLCKDDSYSFFTKRFDRKEKKQKVHCEDFAQLTLKTRSEKFESTLEELAGIVDKYCTFPVPEKVNLFKTILFNFLTGNSNAHLKKFSLQKTESIVKFTPFYGLRNTTIINSEDTEIALTVRGKNKHLNKEDLINYFGKEILNLNNSVILDILNTFESVIEKWADLISKSFLPVNLKEKYFSVLGGRIKSLFS